MKTNQCANMELLFSSALDGRLEQGEQMMFDTHLRDCDCCRQDYEQFERLFTAVASLPGSTMNGPVPYPQTVRSFKGKDQTNLPWWGRFGITAAAAVLLALVGLAAFQAGRQKDQEQSMDGDEVGEVEFVQPSEPVARQLKSWHHGVESLPVLLEAADHYPGKHVQGVLSSLFSECQESSRHFLTLDRTSLGSLEGQTKNIATEFIHCLADMKDQPQYRNRPAKWIHQAKNRFEDARVADCRSELNFMVRGFAENENEPDHFGLIVADPLAKDIGQALRWFVKGDPKQSRVFLDHVKPRLLNKSSTPLYHLITALENSFVVNPRGRRTSFSVTMDVNRHGTWTGQPGLRFGQVKAPLGQVRVYIGRNKAVPSKGLFELKLLEQRNLKQNRHAPPAKKLKRMKVPAKSRKPQKVVL